MPVARQSLLRNLIKIALPWQLGHTVALGFANAGNDVPVWLWMLTGITYGWALANLLLLVLPSGKPVHDRLAGTVVVRATPRERKSQRPAPAFICNGLRRKQRVVCLCAP